MSLRTLCDRRVEIIPIHQATRDAHGRPTIEACKPVGPIRAHRHRSDTEETITDRDRQDDTFLYLLELRTVAGDRINIHGSDRLHDIATDQTFEIVGDPVLARRRRIPHHWEARGRLVTG